jgi:RNA recognition motif-containing protein
MSKRIYVGNLPWSVTRVVLENLFSGFGEIEDALVIADRQTGRSRGFGFVTFKEDKSAEKAIKDMHDKGVEGRNLVVKEATPLGERVPKEQQETKEEIFEEKQELEEKPMEETKPKKKAGRKPKVKKTEEEI